MFENICSGTFVRLKRAKEGKIYNEHMFDIYFSFIEFYFPLFIQVSFLLYFLYGKNPSAKLLFDFVLVQNFKHNGAIL